MDDLLTPSSPSLTVHRTFAARDLGADDGQTNVNDLDACRLDDVETVLRDSLRAGARELAERERRAPQLAIAKPTNRAREPQG